MWKGESYEATGYVDGVGTVWPESTTGMSKEEEDDCLFVATPYTADTGAGETPGVKLDLSVLLDIMVAWVRKVLM